MGEPDILPRFVGGHLFHEAYVELPSSSIEYDISTIADRGIIVKISPIQLATIFVESVESFADQISDFLILISLIWLLLVPKRRNFDFNIQQADQDISITVFTVPDLYEITCRFPLKNFLNSAAEALGSNDLPSTVHTRSKERWEKAFRIVDDMMKAKFPETRDRLLINAAIAGLKSVAVAR